MDKTAIKFENVSKQYRLGTISTGTISHDLNRWWHQIRGLEDPYLKIGEANDRSSKAESDYVWALRDISFEVKQGEVLGIIGRNGAGKSTLLKILSRVTTPTVGSIKAKGRIASLLEVGTGFHPEMTGRENIFMNGAIMGMSKQEIKSKFDEIVDFAGVEKYVNTPVKRYSSGMTVRLGFAIAAHLEPEILVVDEVLAVGDAEFQKKAIGKMQDVSKGEGRTVLFVSHNMASMRALCSKGVILKNGEFDYMGKIDDCIERYIISGESQDGKDIVDLVKYNTSDIQINSFTINGLSSDTVELQNNEYTLDFVIKGTIKTKKKMALEVRFFDTMDKPIFFYSPSHYSGDVPLYPEGDFEIVNRITLPTGLNKGTLLMSVAVTHPGYQGYIDINNPPLKLNINGTMLGNGNVFDASTAGILLLY